MLQYLKYLQYIPLLAQLITFIRTAESSFRGAGSGAKKAQWVADQFSMLVTAAESVGLLSKGSAKSLRDGAGAIITAIVEAMKDAQGGVPALPVPDAGGSQPDIAPAPSRSFSIGDVLTTQPNFTLDIRPGEDVYQHGEDSQWTVRQRGINVGPKLLEPWRVVFSAK